ncbi:MAG: Asp-tRNA(Asn)/Glu-tRNA(Gln) amidotransferase subunit GatA [Myxococcales bacterium]|nr:Asp-tRNA(Asn)/Glu-tRNA(Gln) amidotransferase subunit GatA [Myxococcales bacterium]
MAVRDEIGAALAALASGEAVLGDALDGCAEQIEARAADLGVFISVDLDGARARAAELIERDATRLADALPLCGVPVAVKDNMTLPGLPTTCGSRMLEGWQPPYEATIVERLRAAGALVVGKTNMDEFAMGSSNENSAYGPCKNPWDPERVPGGSSGGSAAAVAARMALGALGSDTGGSIRQPAAFCGVVGLKPTYGRISRYGLVAFASSLDQPGPLARDVKSCARLYAVVGGHDRRDSTSLTHPLGDVVAAASAGEGAIDGLRVGVLSQSPVQVAPEVASGVTRATRALAEMGAELHEITLPHAEHALATYYLICTAEASSNLARYDGVRYGHRAAQANDLGALYRQSRAAFGDEVKRRILLGTFALSAGYHDDYYLRAQKVRTLIRRDFEKCFSQCDVLLLPTTPTLPFRRGEKTADPVAMYQADAFTVPASLAGLPALSMPCAVAPAAPEQGRAAPLPVGLQLIAPALEEARLFSVAGALEAALDVDVDIDIAAGGDA